MGRLSPVLHALPLPPSCSRPTRGCPFSRGSVDRSRESSRPSAGAPRFPRPLPARRPHERRAPCQARGPLRRPRGKGRPEEGGVHAGADSRQRPQAEKARPAPRVDARTDGLVGLRRSESVRRGRRRSQGGLRPRGGRPAPATHALGHRLQRRALHTNRCRRGRARGGPGCGRSGRRGPLPRAPGRGLVDHPSARRERDRPLAGPGLAGPGAPPAGRAVPTDTTLCLALVHHVSLSANVPIRSFLDWLAELQTEVVIEFPTRDDPMVRRLWTARARRRTPTTRRRHSSGRSRSASVSSAARSLPSGTRVLYRAVPAA